MAKLSGECIFCRTDPCFCVNYSKKSTPKISNIKKSVPAPRPEPVIQPKRAGLSSLHAEKPKPLTVRPSMKAMPQEQSFKDYEAELSDAVTVLAAAGILHFDDIKAYYAMIKLPDHEKDSLIWKSQHNEMKYGA
jgi:hypothetical protein